MAIQIKSYSEQYTTLHRLVISTEPKCPTLHLTRQS